MQTILNMSGNINEMRNAPTPGVCEGLLHDTYEVESEGYIRGFVQEYTQCQRMRCHTFPTAYIIDNQL